MTTYSPADRVWVKLEDGGWWPARVLSSAEQQEPLQPGCDTALFLYSDIENVPLKIYHVHSRHVSMCFFETSSPKAVTDNRTLKAAILNAMNDSNANPLQTEAIASTTAPRATAPAPRMKRPREAPPEESYLSPGEEGAYRMISEGDLRSFARDIDAAVRSKDLKQARKALQRLDNVDVTLRELERTHIGVAVGNVLGEEVLRPLWPLARGIISFWARHLPKTTLNVVQSIKSGAFAKPHHEANAGLRSNPINLHTLGSPSSPLSLNTGVGVMSPSSPSPSQSLMRSGSMSKFRAHICAALSNPADWEKASPERVEAVSTALELGIVNTDARHLLLSRLRNPELTEVRSNLLSGKWSVKQYLEMPEDVFVTDTERNEEVRRTAEALDADEQARLATTHASSMFQCEACGKRRCSFYEQQTRGADEPTTKFITCLECKTTWTQE